MSFGPIRTGEAYKERGGGLMSEMSGGWGGGLISGVAYKWGGGAFKWGELVSGWLINGEAFKWGDL